MSNHFFSFCCRLPRPALKGMPLLLPISFVAYALLAQFAFAGPIFDPISGLGEDYLSLRVEIRDDAQRGGPAARVNVTHKRIPEIGWPSMTMDFPLLEGAHIDSIKLGEPVWIVLSIAPGGGYGIKKIAPVSEPKPILHSGEVLAEGVVNELR